MLNKKSWFFLGPIVLLITNIIYLTLVLSNKTLSESGIRLDNLSNAVVSGSEINATAILLFPLIALIINLVGIFITIILTVVGQKSSKNNFDFYLILLVLTTIGSWILLFYSQLITSQKVELLMISWLSENNVWILMGMILTVFVASIFIYFLVNAKLFNKNIFQHNYSDTLNSEGNYNSRELTIKDGFQGLKTEDNPEYNFSSQNVQKNAYQMAINNKSSHCNNSEIRQKVYANISNMEAQSQVVNSLVPENTKTYHSQGVTEQIKIQYEKDFVLVKEIHRINLGQNDWKVSKLVNIFYDRYELGQDLDVDRIMLSIYRVALEHNSLHIFLKDALIYKLNHKFISKGTRKWFESYCDNLNSFYKVNRTMFKKYILQGISIMDEDIKKYLKTLSARRVQ